MPDPRCRMELDPFEDDDAIVDPDDLEDEE